MINGLRNYHQRKQNNINQMLQGYQNNQNYGYSTTSPFNRPNVGMTHGNQFFGKPQIGQNIGGNRNGIGVDNRARLIIEHLMKVKEIVEKDFKTRHVIYKDLSNFNNNNDLYIFFEITTEVNQKQMMLNLRINPQFPKQPPIFSFNQILIHNDIDRSDNSVKLENISPWNSQKPMGVLVKEIEEYFKISPPENSPQLQFLFEQIKKIDQAINSFKNLDFQAFIYNMDEGQKSAFMNGDYGALRESSEFLNVKKKMMETACHLNDQEIEIREIRDKLENLRNDNQGSVEEYKKLLDELNTISETLGNYQARYDDENVKRYLQEKINSLNVKKEELREKMIECEYDELNQLQEEFLETSVLLSKYVTLHEKAFAL